MHLIIECGEEVDGRWLAEIPQLPGVLCYGRTANEAISKAQILALRTLVEQI